MGNLQCQGLRLAASRPGDDDGAAIVEHRVTLLSVELREGTLNTLEGVFPDEDQSSGQQLPGQFEVARADRFLNTLPDG